MTQNENTYKLPESWSWVKLNDISLPIEKAIINDMNPDSKSCSPIVKHTI
ncbi:MAG TPA: hypothetical protein VFQ86_11340 [Arachidicoccus soli]|nr:hypothetical protein [Arachidicoccus soli]